MNFNLQSLHGMQSLLDPGYEMGLMTPANEASLIDPLYEIGMLTGTGTIPGQTLPASGTAPRPAPMIMGMPAGTFLLVLAAIVAAYLLMKDKK